MVNMHCVGMIEAWCSVHEKSVAIHIPIVTIFIMTSLDAGVRFNHKSIDRLLIQLNALSQFERKWCIATVV